MEIMSSSHQAILRSRRDLVAGLCQQGRRTLDAEGGCGVIGVISSDPLPGKTIIRPCNQMRNRGNGKGGGIAAVGLFGDRARDYALQVAYLDEESRTSLEKEFVEPNFEVAHAEQLQHLDDHRDVDLEIRPPTVWRYFVRVRGARLAEFAASCSIADEDIAEDEFVYQNSFRLNRKYYADADKPQAFVLSHGRNLMILKGVGYAEQIAQYYCLEDTNAHVWIGHQRYPTRGRVWHPGGAHPFAGLHEALVHNGDFANYYSVTEYLRQRGIVPLFVTDTEVSVLLFDLYARVLRYPLEHVIEALAPTPEGDFERLSKRRQRIYRAIQSAHLHGSPDGPWFFIVARTEPETGAPQLIGITDVSMLRPQVFALQKGDKSYGAIASEKQAIDAFFEEVSLVDPNVPEVADLYWNARGGSFTDGGAFAYTLQQGIGHFGRPDLVVQDKFGGTVSLPGSTPTEAGACISDEIRPIRQKIAGINKTIRCVDGNSLLASKSSPKPVDAHVRIAAACHFFSRETLRPAEVAEFVVDFQSHLQGGVTDTFVESAVRQAVKSEGSWQRVLAALSFLRDRRWDPKGTSRSVILGLLDRSIWSVLDTLPGRNDQAIRLTYETAWADSVPPNKSPDAFFVVDARKFPVEGPESVSRLLVAANEAGWRKFVVYRCHGDRFIGCGLGPSTGDVRIDVYGSGGDYLGSGLDGGQIVVHADAQDQVGQILKSGRIVVFGDVGQTFLYGAKGGEAFVMGSAAGRPLINAVGNIRAVINGTCLDYCAESFMAGKQTDGGFVVINGLCFDERGEVIGIENKYPGNNLFSLASGGACYLNDPYHRVNEAQLNGAVFVPFRQADWNILQEYLRANEMYFGMSVRNDLLVVDGVLKWPKEVFRKIVASTETAGLDWSALAG